MNLYLEYELYKRKYYEAQQNFNAILSEKEALFSRTQPKTTDLTRELVDGGTPSNAFDDYIIEKEKKQIDERLEEARLILDDRSKLTELKLEELRGSKNIDDKIYVCRYIDRMKIRHIQSKVGYGEAQIYRRLKFIKKNLKMIENDRKKVVL